MFLKRFFRKKEPSRTIKQITVEEFFTRFGNFVLVDLTGLGMGVADALEADGVKFYAVVTEKAGRYREVGYGPSPAPTGGR